LRFANQLQHIFRRAAKHRAVTGVIDHDRPLQHPRVALDPGGLCRLIVKLGQVLRVPECVFATSQKCGHRAADEAGKLEDSRRCRRIFKVSDDARVQLIFFNYFKRLSRL
jgi:hypothetical protein